MERLHLLLTIGIRLWASCASSHGGRSRSETSVPRGVLAAMALACAALSGVAESRGDDSLGTIHLRLEKVGEEEVKPDKAPRLAVFLIDCSSSMDNSTGINNLKLDPRTKRRDAVYTALRMRLSELAGKSPGIQVRIRFFHEQLGGEEETNDRKKRWAQISGVVDDETSVTNLMNRIPIDQPSRNGPSGVRDVNAFTLADGTSLYRSSCTVIDRMLEEHARRGFGWMFFGVYSDGADTVGGKTSADLDEALKRFRSAGPGFEGFTWKVGSDATSVDYGTEMKTGDIGQNIPEPPPPRVRFELRPAADQPIHVDFDRLATPGPHRVSFLVDGPADLRRDLHTAFHLGPDTPFRLQTTDGSGYGDGPVSATLDLPRAADVTKGVAVSLRLAATGPAEAPFSIEGEPEFFFTFKASRTLPPAEWQALIPEHVRGGDPVKCSINPGVVTDPLWTFVGPAERSVEARGLVVAPVLERGPWTVSFRGTADSGQLESRSFGVIEVIDADFDLQPPAVAVPAGSPAEVAVLPVPGAAEARYEISVDGVALAAPTPRIVIPAQSLNSVGRHVLTVTCSSRKGNYSWTHDAVIDVLFSPRVEILTSDHREGRENATVNLLVSGDVGDAVMVRVDGHEPYRQPVIFDDPAKTDRSAQPRITVPTESVGRTFDLEVRPVREGACEPAKARIEGRPADVRCLLKSPLDGSTFSISTSPPLEVEPAGEDIRDIGEVSFEIGFRRGGITGSIEKTATATRAADWRVALPADLAPGPLEIFARPIGRMLRPDLYPEGKDWQLIATLHVAPQVPWIALSKADPPSSPPKAPGEAAVLGPVRPGKPVTLELKDVPSRHVESIRWEMGPLEGDPDLAKPIEHSGGRDLLAVPVTPKAVGLLPLKATIGMDDGTEVPPALAGLSVVARRPRITADLRQRDAGGRTSSPAGSADGDDSLASFVGGSDLTFRPGIDGDFVEAHVAIFDRHAPEGTKPYWEHTFLQDTEEIPIPLAALPPVERGACSRDFEIRLKVTPYPGDDLPPPPPYTHPFAVQATKHWGWFSCLATLVTAAIAWLGKTYLTGHHLAAATLCFDVDPLPAPEDSMRPSSGYKLRIDGRRVTPAVAREFASDFLPWRLFGRREARIPLGLLARIITKIDSSKAPRVDWILREPHRVNHSMIVTGNWRTPFWHQSEAGGRPQRQPSSAILGVDFSDGVFDPQEKGTERVSATQKISPSPVTGPADSPLYYRLHWPRYSDPYAWWLAALLLPWALSMLALARFCNVWPCPN